MMTFPDDGQETAIMKFPLPEVVTVPRHVRVRRVVGVIEAALAERLSAPIPSEAIGQLPAGPSQEARLSQRFTVAVDARSADGGSLRGVVEGSDTYGTAAVVAAECIQRLIAYKPEPGVLTPAQAFDPVDLLESLARRGIRWRVQA
jgi:short subunit dehydrogenase-like uncharacterized protein